MDNGDKKDEAKLRDEFRDELLRMLEAFQKRVDGIEKRVQAAVDRRASDQSAAMARTEEEVTELRGKIAPLGDDVSELRTVVTGVIRADKETRRRIGEVGEQVKQILAVARSLDEKAGDRFGKRMDAMSSQVLALVSMGQRLEAVELKCRGAQTAAANAWRDLAVYADENKALRDRIARLEDAVFPPPKPKDVNPLLTQAPAAKQGGAS